MFDLIVGLGNPGSKYRFNRHNIGNLFAEYLAEKEGNGNFSKKFKGLYCQVNLFGKKRVLLLPQTYMNLSGESVRPCADFFKISADKILVLHDELDHEAGLSSFKFGGGLAGHNGLKSISQHMGTQDFGRIRMGIGRPVHGDVSSFVLSNYPEEDVGEFRDWFDFLYSGLELCLTKGIKEASNKFNKKHYRN